MKKIILSLLLIITFAASFGSLGDVSCAGGMSQITAFDCESECGASPETTEAEHSHCASHCSHSVSAYMPTASLKLQVEVLIEINSSYLFAYNSPTLDSIERPPLAS